MKLMTKHTPHLCACSIVSVGNLDLENETFDSFELSYERRTAVSALISRFYKGTVEDRIIAVLDPALPLPAGRFGQRFDNDSQGSDQIGLTTTWDRTFSKKWSSTITWRYLRAKSDDGTTSFYSPKHVINLMATYNPLDRLTLNLFSKTTTSYSTEEGTQIGTDFVGGYTKLDFAVKYKTVKDGSQQLWLRINNLTDREVVEAYGLGAGTFGPGWENGRNFTAGYSFKF